MPRKRVVILATAGALFAATAITAATAPAQAQPAAPSAQAMAASAADNLVASRVSALHASADDTFAQHQVISSHGLQYVPYDRTYKGLPVVGGDFVVVTNSAGQVLNTSVAQDSTINLTNTTPSVSKAKAESIARGQISTVDSVGGTRKIVFALGTPKLAWETTVIGRDAEGPNRSTVVVDAATGAVLHTQEHVLHGTGTGAWNGPNPLSLGTTQSGGTFALQDPNHTSVECQDAATNTTFTKSTDQWGNGDASSRETGCVDALFTVETEEQMLSQWLGRNGFDGNGGGWPIRVGLAQVNAYYDGTQVQIGHNQANQWISAIDVVAHEHGHGIDDHTPGGISGSGTQEFVADVFGASTEWFANEPAPFATPDFLVGDQVNLVGSGPIRNMYNPSQINNDPNCYSSSIPSTEVHKAAGPGNHWFYLAAEGTNPTNGQPTSPTCNSSTVTGLGVQTALTIFYNAMLMKTTGSSYPKYRTWTLTAAKNLTPGNCTDFNTIKAAWDAVSVPAQSGDPTCTSGSTVTVTNPGSRTGTVGTAASLQMSATGGTAPYTWSATGLPTGLSINASGLISGTPTTANTFNVSVTATDSASPSHTGSTSFSWTINPQGGGGGITNGDFEAGSLSGWTTTGTTSVVNSGAHSGTYAAQVGSTSPSNDSSISQTFTVPANNTGLSFWYNVNCPDTVTYDWATATLKDNTTGTTTTVLAQTCTSGAGWTQATGSVTAGHSYTLTLTSHDDNYPGDPTYTLFDDVTLS